MHAKATVRLCLGLILTLCSLISIQLNAQVTVARSVLGSGATTSTADKVQLRATVGQSATGRLSSTSDQHLVGYWYTVMTVLDAAPVAALVLVPNTHAAPGQSFALPLILQQSKALFKSGVRSFRAVLRFNATLMEPTDKSSYTRLGDSGRVIVSGLVSDSAQILANLNFQAKLGNSESTNVVIEEFQFLENASVTTVRKNGIFSLDGVCRENGQIRLVKTTQATSLEMYPNPAADNAQIRAVLGERGMTLLSLIDERGVSIATYFDAEASPGTLLLQADLREVPSGSYFLLLRTPNEVFSQKVIVQK